MPGPRKPGSAVRPKAAAAISLGASSRTPANDLPEDLGAGSAILLFGLPPGGVCRAVPVFRDAVSSYLTVSPLPSLLPAVRRFDLCGTFPVLADGGRYPPPCPWEPGLSSRSAKLPAAARGPGARTLVRARARARENSKPVRCGETRFCATEALCSADSTSERTRAFSSSRWDKRSLARIAHRAIGSAQLAGSLPFPRPDSRVRSPSPGGSLLSLAPCFGVLLLCAQLTGQAASDAPPSVPSRVVDASFSASSRAVDAPLSVSMSASTPAADAAPRQPSDANGNSIAVISAPEPGLLLLAGSLTVWFALSRRRAGAARA